MDGLDVNAPLNKNPTNEERWDATFQEKEGKRPRMRREERGGTYLARTRTFAGMRWTEVNGKEGKQAGEE